MMTVWFYVKQNGMTVAKGCCTSKEEAESHAMHYALMYGQDKDEAPVKVSYRIVKERE